MFLEDENLEKKICQIILSYCKNNLKNKKDLELLFN